MIGGRSIRLWALSGFGALSIEPGLQIIAICRLANDLIFGRIQNTPVNREGHVVASNELFEG